MIYIPNNWFKNKQNVEAVYRIIDSVFFTDLNLHERVDDAILRLREIGEDEIADRLQRGEIVLST